MDGREYRVFAAALGDIEASILAGKVPDVVGTEGDEIEGQVLTPVFLDMTNEVVGDVDLPRLDVRLQARRVLQRHAVRLLLPGAVGNLDETGISGEPQLRAELRPAELALDVARRLEQLDRIGVDQGQRIALRPLGMGVGSAAALAGTDLTLPRSAG